MERNSTKPDGSVLESLRKTWLLLTRRNRLELLSRLGVTIIQSLLELVGIGAVPAFVGALADPNRFLQHPIVGPFVARLGIKTQLELIASVTLGLVLVFAVKTLYSFFATWLNARFLQGLRVRLGSALFEAYMRGPYAFHLRRNPAEMMRNVSQEVDRLVFSVVNPVLMMVAQGIISACIVTLMLVVDPGVTLLGIGLFAGTGYAFLALIRKRASALGRSAQEHRGQLIKAINEGFGSFKEARILGREREFITAFERNTKRLAEAAVHVLTSNAMIPPGLEFVAVVGLSAIVMVVLASGIPMHDVVPLLALFAAALVRLRQSLSQIVSTLNAVRYEHVTVEPIYRDLMELAALPDAPQPSSASSERMPLTNSIELENISFQYNEGGPWALRNVNIVIPRGSSVAFVGATGAGKSTLADVVLGLLVPQQGAVKVDGHDVRDRLRAWQATLGYIPQSLYLVDDTVRRNIALGLPDSAIDEKRVRDAAQMAQLDEVVAGLAEGFDTVLGDRGVRLSGGQRQRVCIARALYHDPDVLILDEATSALDNLTERRIVEELEVRRGNRTLIIIAHRLSTVRRCDRLYVLRDGRVESEGTFDELVARDQRFQALAAADS